MEYTVLIVEDEKPIADAIAIYLHSQKYKTIIAENGEAGLQAVKDHEIHLAIVDIMMPVMDGITMTTKLRETYDFPILFLSAKSEEIDKINGLNIGGDDYITKPFTPMELLARVNAHIRRYERYLQKGAVKNDPQTLIIGGIELHLDSKEVYVDGQLRHLTPLEFKILQLFMEHPGRVYSSEEIYETIWQESAISTETVMVHIRNLREKLEIDPKNPRYIKVVWGVGYKIEKI